MRLSIETSFRFIARGGVTRYIVQLLKGLREVAPDMAISELCCAIPNFDYRQPRRSLVTAYREYFWTPLLVPRILSKQRPDIVHMTCFPDIPVPGGIPKVATLHDLSQIRYPHAYRHYTRRRWRYLFNKMREADAIISVSNFSKREAMELLEIPSDRIHTIHLAHTPVQPSAIPADLSALLPSRFFLFVGSLSPRKNLNLLIQTYRLADERRVKIPPLVVVGARVEGVARESKPPSSWIFAGRVDDGVLASLYSRAIALVYPSFYEGFGIPVLEAMAQNCPVICSPVASLPEAGGEAAFYADQTPEAYLDAMVQLDQNHALRQEFVEKGAKHIEAFSWQETARRTLSVYQSLC